VGYLWELDEGNKVARCVWEGRIASAELLEGVAWGRRFVAEHPGCRAITDFSGVTAFDVSSEVIRELAYQPTHGDEQAVVVIVASQDLVFGLGRMFSMLTEKVRPNRHVVRTIEEAYELLGIKEPQFSRIESA
jgi:hypothetical protein